MKKNIKLEKSKITLREALIQLLSERDFSKITINDICQQANVGRSTFYNHYKDKITLLEDVVSFYSRIANDTTYAAFVTEDHLNLHSNLLRDYHTIVEYHQIIQALYSVHLPNADFEGDVRAMLARKYKLLLDSNPAQNCIPEALAVELYTANALLVTKYIAYHADTANIEQLADFMFSIYQTILSPIESPAKAELSTDKEETIEIK